MSVLYFYSSGVPQVWACVGWAGRAWGEACQQCNVAPCRRVTGIFTRPTLPVGYNLIARVPIHACNITVTELAGSSNYLGKDVGSSLV